MKILILKFERLSGQSDAAELAADEGDTTDNLDDDDDALKAKLSNIKHSVCLQPNCHKSYFLTARYADAILEAFPSEQRKNIRQAIRQSCEDLSKIKSVAYTPEEQHTLLDLKERKNVLESKETDKLSLKTISAAWEECARS